MFIEDWNSFYEQAEQLYRNDPLRTRYVTKYKHTSGKLILKVTDDRVVGGCTLLGILGMMRSDTSHAPSVRAVVA